MELMLLHLFLAMLGSILSIYMVLTRQHIRARIITFIILGASIWSYGYSLEMFYTTYETKLFWLKIQFIGIVLSNFWPLFIMNYFNDRKKCTPLKMLMFGIVPLIVLILAFTTENHNLLFESISLNHLNLNYPLIRKNGVGMTHFYLYTYALYLGSSVYSVKKVIEDQFKHKKQVTLILTSVLIPITVSFTTHFIQKNPLIDYTSATYTLVGLALVIFAPTEIRIGNIVPLAYAKIIGGMKDLVILTNQDKEIIHLNPSAKKWFGTKKNIDPNKIIGKKLSRFVPELENTEYSSTPVTYLDDTFYDQSSFQILNWKGKNETQVIVLRDISDRVKIERNLRSLHLHATKIANAKSLEEVGEITFRAMNDSLGFTVGRLDIIEDEEYRMLKSWGIAKSLLVDEHVLNWEIPRKVTVETESKLLNNIKDTEFFHHSFEVYRSAVIVPVKINQTTLGNIQILGKTTNQFSEIDQMLLETFAEHVASAIERIRQEKLLIQMQKDEIHQILEGASKVSNLVRHDLRGPLQTIRNASYLLMDKKATVEDMTPIINRSIEYMAKIIEDLRYMGNQGALEQLEIDLNNLIIQSIRQIFIPDNIQVEINFTEKKLVHQLDKIRIHRVLDNLIRNAVEAMPDGGKLTITTKKSTENISVIIEDTGHGIENMEDLFKPFHTTKEKGMGLGLISCKQAIEAHKGELKAFSEVGKGSRFEVIFPIQDKLDGEQCYQTQHHYADVEHEAQFS